MIETELNEELEPIEDILIQEKTTENRGKPFKCKYCKKEFRIPNIEDKKAWQNSNCICPLCKEMWCTIPPTERKLKYLQEDYLNNRCEETIVPFIRLLDIYCQSIIKKNYKIYLKYEGALEYYSYNAVTALIEEYLSREEFKIDVSFGGYMIWKIKQAIFHPSELESSHISLDYEFEDGNNLHEMIACDRGTLDAIENAEYTNTLYQKIVGIIEGVEEYCKNPYEDYIRTISMNLYFKDGETSFDKLFQAFGREGKMIAMNTIDLLRKDLAGGAELVSAEISNLIKADIKPVEKQKKLKYPNLDNMKQRNTHIIPELKMKGEGVRYFEEL